MKRNLSSQAIKAMAIGMAVMMGSSTAISGVITGTVVNAYAAATITVTNPNTFAKIDTSSTIVTNSGLLFKVTKAPASGATTTSDDGEVTFLGEIKDGETITGESDGTVNKPYLGTLDAGAGKVKITDTNDGISHTMTIKQIGNGSNALGLFTNNNLSAPQVDAYTLNVSNVDFTEVKEVKNKAFEGVTVTGDLDLSNATTVSQDAFSDGSSKGINISGNLTLPTGFTGKANMFHSSTIGTLTLPANYTGVANDFSNITSLDTLDLSAVTDGLAASTFEGTTAIGTLKLNTATTFAEDALSGVTITNLEHNGKALMSGSTTGATITNLTFAGGVTEIAANAFKNATIPAKITLTEVKTIGADAFKIASPESVTVDLPAYTDGDVGTINAAAFGDASGKNFTINVAEDVTEKTLTDKLTNKNVTVKVAEKAQAPTLSTATIENTNPSEVVLKFSENVKVASVDNQPAKTEFTVTVDGKPNEVTTVSEIAQDATSDTVKLTLTTPVTKGQKVTITYTPGNNKILNAKDVALEKITDAEVTNNVGVVEDFTATTNAGTYTFQKLTDSTVALTKFEAAKGKKSAGNTFVNGIFTQNGKAYTLTQIGTGTVVAGLTDAALKGHTNNVTVVKKDAFKGNTVITEISLPKVTTVEAGAFNGATKLATMDLGSETANKVTIASDAFTNTTSLKNITTNAASASDIQNKVPNANVVVQSEVKNDSKASIRYNAYYQTKDGLRFVGINEKELKFVGTKTYQEPTNGKFDGTEANPYEVTYDKTNGTVTVTPGKDEVVVDTVEVTQNGYKLTFDIKDSNATLTNAIVSKTKVVTTTGTLANGVVTDANGKQYNFTTIGNGTDTLAADFNATTVLKDNLNKVTTIANNAFKGNTVTTELTLPAVTNIGADAFNGATALTKVDLGTNEVTVGAGAFTGATSVKVTSGNQTTIDNLTKPETGLDAGKVETPESKKFVKSAVIENGSATEIKLTLDKALTTAIDANDGFTVKVNDTDAKITSVAGGDSSATNIITITLQTAVKAGEKVTVSYDGTNPNATDLLTFTDKAVENNVGVVAPEAVTIGSATADATKIILTISEGGLKNISQQAPTGFTVTKGGSTATDEVTLEANGLTVTGNNTIELTVQGGIAKTDGNIKVTYAGGNENLVKDANNAPITIADTHLVDNTTDVTAPTFSTLTGEYTTNTITLTADEYLKPITEASANGFTLKLGTLTGSATVTNVEIAEDSKDIVLTIDEGSLDGTDGTITVKYTQPNGGKNIADINGNEIATDDSTGVVVTVTSRVETASLEKAVKGYVEYNTTSTTGDVTVISVETAPANSVELQNIQAMLTNKLTRIERLTLKGYTSLDFSKVNVSNLNIYGNAITGGTLNITSLNSAQQLELAKRFNGIRGIEIGGKTPQQIIDINYGSGSSNNGSSSGGSSSGSSSGGAIIGGVTDGNTENNNNNNNNTNNQVSQDKQLTFDAISLPSINGEPKMFGDVPANHWAKSYIDKLSTAGIINGANGNFMPNGQTKRADVTIMLVNLLGLSPEVNNKFADVNPNAYYAPYVGTASSYGIVNGSNGMFNPEGIISRQDTMVMIAQILKGLNLNVNTDASSLGQFSDLGSVSNYAQESVAILVNSGIITGNNGKLNPKAPVTRAEMATIMSKLYDVLAAAK